MFELNALKSKKLSDLQEIAKSIGLTGVSSQKKQDLIYQIIDHQSANPTESNEKILVDTNKQKSITKSKPAISKENKNENRNSSSQKDKKLDNTTKQNTKVSKESINDDKKSKNIPRNENNQRNENQKPKPHYSY